ncbi:hypothetical protein [Nocardia yamanashiensis]|nr:hypothetical protein [Nocardia yamanashiensis]
MIGTLTRPPRHRHAGLPAPGRPAPRRRAEDAAVPTSMTEFGVLS